MSINIKEKMLAIASAAAAIAVAGLVATGCASKRSAAPKPAKLTILSDRECIPPPYASPAQLAVSRTPAETTQPPAAIKPGDDFVPAPMNAPAELPGEAPVFEPAGNVPQEPVAFTPADPTAKPKPVAKPKPARTYKVVRGDSLSVIAYMYKINWRDLAAENNLTDKSTLRIGQTLRLPSSAAETPRKRPVIKRKPAVQKPAAPKKAAAPAAAASVDTVSGDVYVVKSGDNLWLIAKRNKIKEADIRALNPQIKDFSKLQIGDKIRLRAAGSTPKAAPKAKDDAPTAPIPVVAPIEIPGQINENNPPAANNALQDAAVPEIPEQNTIQPVPAVPVIQDVAPDMPPAITPANAIKPEPQPNMNLQLITPSPAAGNTVTE